MPQEKAQEKPKPKSKGKGKAKATESDFLDLSSDDSAPLAQSDQEEDVQVSQLLSTCVIIRSHSCGHPGKAQAQAQAQEQGQAQGQDHR